MRGMMRVAGWALFGVALGVNIAVSGPQAGNRSPSQVYTQMLMLQTQGRWAEVFDLFDPESHARMSYEIRAAMLPIAPNESQRSKINTMDAEELLIYYGNLSTPMPTQIMSENIDGDEAILNTRIRKNNALYDRKVHMRKIDGEWKLVW